jgi:hypothetical protein
VNRGGGTKGGKGSDDVIGTVVKLPAVSVPVKVELSSAVDCGTGTFGVRILVAGAVEFSKGVLTLVVESEVRGITPGIAVSFNGGRDGNGIAGGKVIIVGSGSDMFPSKDEVISGMEDVVREVTISVPLGSDVGSRLSIAETTEEPSPGTTFGISVAPDVSVVVILRAP